jgi:hypothetical protein
MAASGGGGLRARHLLIFLAAAALYAASSPAGAFYLPGVAPRDFQKVIDRLISWLIARMFLRFLSLSNLALGVRSRLPEPADLAVLEGAASDLASRTRGAGSGPCTWFRV